MIKKFKNLALVGLAVSTINLGQLANASCTKAIVDSDFEIDQYGFQHLSGQASVLGIVGTFTLAGEGLAAAAFPLGAAAITSSTVAASVMDDLDQSEAYAYKVLDYSSLDESYMAPIMASFTKGVQRQIGQNPNVVIPTEFEVVEELKQIDNDLTACTDENGEFFRPTKESLNSLVVENLTY